MAAEKTKFKTIRWSKDQYAFIEKMSDKAGVSFGRYVRQVAIGKRSQQGELIGKDHRLKQILRQLSGIANNYNQIARKVNQTGQLNQFKLKETQREFNRLTKVLLQELK